eukprot:TRINITY_DN18974_c0_g1_i1.p1 TRINITY_DN18974_c0_g1~~TRINITY_DN18974_c0_g1_i1.p1  ORF type:complete len:62 (+),score=2.16 TRINITY_DN18974_c0_g1_i1:174-359(+)
MMMFYNNVYKIMKCGDGGLKEGMKRWHKCYEKRIIFVQKYNNRRLLMQYMFLSIYKRLEAS